MSLAYFKLNKQYKSMDILSKIKFFYKYANDLNEASYAVEKLKSDKFFDSSLWFSKNPSVSNIDKSFAIFDKKLQNKVKEYGIDYEDSIEYKELKEFIIQSFNEKFGRFKLNAKKVVNLLEDQGNTGLYVLIHDLIHQVFQFYFTDAIESQIYEDDEESGYYIPLLDRLYEDIASSLSNFQPKMSDQGIFAYLDNLFIIKGSEYIKENDGIENFKSLVNEVFTIAKSELRQKKVNNKLKQFADGFFSKLKGQILNKMTSILDQIEDEEELSSIWRLSGLQDEFEKEYYKRIDESELLNEEDAVVLRNWLMSCIKKANEILNKDYYSDED